MATALVFPEAGNEAIVRNLKRPALLFEKIYVLHLTGLLGFLGQVKSENNWQLKADLEWLHDRGIVATADHQSLVDPFIEAAQRHPRIAVESFEYACQLSDLQVCGLNFSALTDSDPVLVCTPEAINLRLKREYLPSVEKKDVLNIVLDAFPEPVADTPWELIAEFREDSQTRTQALALRRWVRKLSSSNVAEKEITDEIEWLIQEYEAHMRLHRMKVSSGTLEMLVVAFAETVENLAKLKFSALARSLFALKHRRIALTDAERQAPGRELAYIVHARERFGEVTGQ